MTPKFDQALDKVMENGTYEKLYKKWFGKEPDMEVLKKRNHNFQHANVAKEQGCRLILGAADFCFMKTREEKEKNDGFSV